MNVHWPSFKIILSLFSSVGDIEFIFETLFALSSSSANTRIMSNRMNHSQLLRTNDTFEYFMKHLTYPEISAEQFIEVNFLDNEKIVFSAARVSTSPIV